MAKIECKIKRGGPEFTKVTIGDTEYQFKPESGDEGAPHVCQVDDEEHVLRFLDIPEGYRLCKGELPPKSADKNAARVVKVGEEEVDLNTLDKPDLIKLSDAAGLELTPGMKRVGEDKLRELIYNSLVEEEPQAE